MIENKSYNDEEIEIDILDLLRALKKKIGVIILAGVIGFGVMFLYSFYLVTPLYSASTMMYVLPTDSSSNSSMLSDMQVGQQLTNDYASMMKSRTFIETVIKNLKLDTDYKHLLKYITIDNPSNSRILQITVENPDPEQAMNIANEVASVAEKKLTEITSMEAARIYEKATLPVEPSSPNIPRNCMMGLAFGLILAIAACSMMYVLDDTIKTEEDIERYLGLTTMAAIPYMDKKFRKRKAYKKKQAMNKKRGA